MYILGIDTSFNYLVLALIKDDQLIDQVFEKAFKTQSELIFVRINELFERNQLLATDIGGIVITKGPGSYTGIRIAMTIAKVYCSQLNLPLYTLPTLMLYAGIKPTMVIMDARAQRAYVGIYNTEQEYPEQVLPLELVSNLRLSHQDLLLYGDGHLVNETDNFSDVSIHFVLLKNRWELVGQVHELTPDYLKEQQNYVNNSPSNG
jgi:tRNA threonylcarbamoyladenosine biosynthesis protein TsaB